MDDAPGLDYERLDSGVRTVMAERVSFLTRTIVGCALGSLAACGPPMERTPQVPGRNDAMGATAQAPVWNPGDVWSYRGHTFDASDNRFYERVISATEEAGRHTYEVDTPLYVETYDAKTLRPLRHRNKDTGQVGGSVTFNPVFFPLNFSTRFKMAGTRARGGEPLRPFSYDCRVVSYEDVEVHAGKFAAFRIDCDTNDGFSEQWYAPEVKNLVKMRWMGDRDTQTSELWEFHLAK
jgi:hypothetical protein